MKQLELIQKRLSELVPEKKRKLVSARLDFAGISQDTDTWLGKRLMLAVLFFLIGFLMPLSLGRFIEFTEIGLQFLAGIIFGIIFFATTLFLYYLHLEYQIDDRRKRVESVLPDFLLLVASNLRSGMTPFYAFKSSSREEFGPLAEEIKTVTAKSLGIESFSGSLKELAKKIDSRILSESVSFFSESLKSGGKLANILEASAEDISKTDELKKEMISGTKMYVMFVLFVIIVATPLLMSISVQFLEMISSIQAQQTTTGTINVGFLSSELLITPDFMQKMALVLFFGNAILSSLFIGVLTERKPQLGIKYFPVIFIASVILFFGFKTLVSGFISVL
ncbi:MAG: type II secretion system F family protein [archaeon]